jgi:hypothetical protein
MRGASIGCADAGAADGIGAGGAYCGWLMGQRGICAELGIDPGGRGSSA